MIPRYDVTIPQPIVYAGSGNRPVAPTRFTGCIGYDTTNDLLEMWTGAAWKTIMRPVTGNAVSFTPQLYGNNVLNSLGTGATTYGGYTIRGPICTYWGFIVIGTGSSITAGAISVSMPFSCKNEAGSNFVVGIGNLNNYQASAHVNDLYLNKVRFARDGGTVTNTTVSLGDGSTVGWVVDYPMA